MDGRKRGRLLDGFGYKVHKRRGKKLILKQVLAQKCVFFIFEFSKVAKYE